MVIIVAIYTFYWILLHYAQADSSISNYFVDKFEGDEGFFAFPLNVCLRTGIQTYQNTIYTCNAAGTQVTRTYYKEKTCDTVTDTKTFTSSDAQSNGAYSFNCDGKTSYMELAICVEPKVAAVCDSCLMSGITFSVVDICHYAGDGSSNDMLQAKCNMTSAGVKGYSAATSCNSSTPATNYFADVGECSYMNEVDTSFGTFDVYAKPRACIIDSITQFSPAPTVAPTRDAASHANCMSIIFYVFSMLLSILQ